MQLVFSASLFFLEVDTKRIDRSSLDRTSGQVNQNAGICHHDYFFSWTDYTAALGARFSFIIIFVIVLMKTSQCQRKSKCFNETAAN